MIRSKRKDTAREMGAPGSRAPGELPAMACDVLTGLLASPKHLPPKWFYDARGSELFERITRLPEYYLTRTEQEILRLHSVEMVEAAGSGLTLLELGAGSATKTGLLLQALLRRQLGVVYVPVDVSRSALVAATRRLRQEFPQVQVRPQVADFTVEFPPLRLLRGRKLALFIGSSIGNFDPGHAVALLRRLRAQLEPGDALLLGTDLAKDPAVLVPAYDDSSGVTAAFNKNVLVRINRELKADFDLTGFRHVAIWNPEHSRMEMHLESRRAQQVGIEALGIVVEFAAGERIHTENSYKYSMEAVADMLSQAGFRRERSWSDSRGWFAVHLARS